MIVVRTCWQQHSILVKNLENSGKLFFISAFLKFFVATKILLLSSRLIYKNYKKLLNFNFQTIKFSDVFKWPNCSSVRQTAWCVCAHSRARVCVCVCVCVNKTCQNSAVKGTYEIAVETKSKRHVTQSLSAYNLCCGIRNFDTATWLWSQVWRQLVVGFL